MIHDAHMEVTCDGKGCLETVNVELEYVYHSYSGKSGQYDSNESKIEATLIEDFEWVVVTIDDGDNKHFCNAECLT